MDITTPTLTAFASEVQDMKQTIQKQALEIAALKLELQNSSQSNYSPSDMHRHGWDAAMEAVSNVTFGEVDVEIDSYNGGLNISGYCTADVEGSNLDLDDVSEGWHEGLMPTKES